MTTAWIAVGQILILVVALAAVHVPLGNYMARVFTSPRHLRVERAGYRALRVDPDADQRWSTYLLSVLGFSLASVLFLYALERLQSHLPLSLGMSAMDPAGAWNTAVSFTTNTNWQWYSGEAAAGHLLQMAGFAVQNFLSAAVGIAVVVALIRGFARSGADGRVGNFWSDLVRTVVRILLPMAFVAAIALISMGAIQNLAAHTDIATLAGGSQHVLGGPVASQEVIKELGTNGGGFFNANSAHPLENPTPLSNLLEIFLILVIPFSLCRTFGIMVGDKRQGWSILAVMGTLWAGAVGLLTWAELAGSGLVPRAVGAAMEGKETRFGAAASALFAASTTSTSTGAVNSMHDSLTAGGGGVTIFNMQLGEISPGGTGSGLYGMLVLAIVAVFIAGLMVGRTPEYLGKKIGRQEITLVALYVLATPAIVLVGTAIAIATPPPPAVNESCIELTAPVDVEVVDAANSALAAAPKRVSLPSIAAPTAWGTRPLPASSAQVSRPTAPAHSVPITARIDQPCRLSPTMIPNVRGSENGITNIKKISSRLLSGVGLSSGCAEFALKNPPPLVPSCLMTS